MMQFPPWRYPHLFKLWQTWLNEGRHHQLDKWLGQIFKQQKQFGKKDRAAYRELMFTAMRFLTTAQWLEQGYQQQSVLPAIDTIDPSALWYWLFLRAEIAAPAPRELSDAAAREQYFTAQRNTLSTATSTATLNYWHGLPPALHTALAERADYSNWTTERTQTFLSNTLKPALLWLRPQQVSAKRCQQFLAAEGITTTINGELLVADGKPALETSQTYRDGLVEIQDAASVALASAIRPTAGQRVWDVCAGAGGKALAIASQYPHASILATDNRAHALNRLNQRAARANIDTITHQVHDATTPLQAAEKFDWILIDAPCSGTGVWRRAADNKHRLQADTTLLQLQAAILRQAAQHLASGGTLVYATCSWLPVENEQQIEQFVHNSPLQLVRTALVGNPMEDADTMWLAELTLP